MVALTIFGLFIGLMVLGVPVILSLSIGTLAAIAQKLPELPAGATAATGLTYGQYAANGDYACSSTADRVESASTMLKFSLRHRRTAEGSGGAGTTERRPSPARACAGESAASSTPRTRRPRVSPG